GDPADAVGKRDRPGIARRVRVALRAVRKTVLRAEDPDHAVRDEPALRIRILKGDHVAHANGATCDRTIERDRADAERRNHRARVHLDGLESRNEEACVRKHAEDGRARNERGRHPHDRPEGMHGYACTADHVKLSVAERPWKALSAASVPVVGRVTWK